MGGVGDDDFVRHPAQNDLVVGAALRSAALHQPNLQEGAMPERSQPPFRADHVGSLLRPPELLAARRDRAAGRISAERLRAVEDDAVRSVVRMQEEVGLRSATDGELRRDSWHMDFIFRLSGVVPGEGLMHVPAVNEEGTKVEYLARPVLVQGRVGVTETIFGEDFRFLRSATATATPKLSIPSPSMVNFRGGREAVSRDVYPDLEEFHADLAGAYAEEIRRLGELGCAYLQLDDTSLAFVNDPALRATLGADAEHRHEHSIRVLNRALEGRPAGMRVTVHLCRGNYRSAWFTRGGYDFVAEALFDQLQVDGFFLEYDDERSGGFEPLRFVPAGRMVVLGLVTTKRGALESKDALKRRVEEASRFVPIEQLCLSPQCGFASTVEGNALSAEEQRAKLRLVVETAAEIWG
jgi:5-methyltetrahydropteroyltriglutamate--homocysteine methyltransferase